MKKNKVLNAIAIVLGVVSIAVTIFVGTNFTLTRDFIRSFSYSPTKEVSEIEQKLDLSFPGALVYKASNPELQNSEDFNEFCESHNVNASILGCYKNEKISVYHIDSVELDGILESTMAHEMMHAVWDRLSESEQKELIPLLDEIFANNSEKLAIINEYGSESKHDELFARVGSELKELPSKLEEVYARYFNNRKQIVAFYEKYYSIFDKLSQNIKRLTSEIEELKAFIEKNTEDYQNRVAVLDQAIIDFNNCAHTTDCFTISSYYSELNRLQTERDELGDLYDILSEKIEEYNKKADEYNSNALKTVYYSNITNSNIERNEL